MDKEKQRVELCRMNLLTMFTAVEHIHMLHKIVSILLSYVSLTKPLSIRP